MATRSQDTTPGEFNHDAHSMVDCSSSQIQPVLRPKLGKEHRGSSSGVDNQRGQTHFYPFSSILISFWIAIIIGTVALLQRSTVVAPTVLVLPWYYSNDGLPTILLTIFAQAHGPITAMHLSRVAMSGLQSALGAPRTWMELFWLSGKNWAGPLGIITSGWTATKQRIQVSFTFILFSTISLVALVTPLVLGRAYPIKALDVIVPQTFFPRTLDVSKMDGIDAYAQIAGGAGAWATGQSVIELYNQTSYTPVGQSRGNTSNDYFFAGDSQSLDTTLPGIHIQGSCSAVNQTGLSDSGAFTDYCVDQMGSMNDAGNVTVADSSLNLQVSICSNLASFAPFNQSQTTNSTAFFWFQNQNITGMLVGNVVTGLVRCDTQTLFGHASLQGRNFTFENFVSDNLYNASQGGEALLDPLNALIYYILDTKGGDGDESLQAAAIDQFGYQEVGSDGGLLYLSPSLEGFASALWNGITNMAVVIAILARDSDIQYNGVAHVTVSGRTRDGTFFISAMVLLLAWFVGITCATVMLLRPTSYETLDGYAAARLLAERPDLVQNDTAGMLKENRRLLDRFEPVS
ncbi:hypothetical protein BT96DRAFT_42100 [Gymnopus androsaceus JB14]|uniref:Uncharacterized protein n=1 Tax=Gymnopus androsaceus JB14 TaxID=1447944 RepID=A0A6A4HM50_9AGAR|nr:hypothetical protein BT96DRAFT_42100 [Gymnopus androsaceus JB14]